MPDIAKLRHCLDNLAGDYGAQYIDSDPVGLVHRYTDPIDCEIAGFIVSTLAYGGAGQIRKSAEDVLLRAGHNLKDFTLKLTPKRALSAFDGFKHRWTDCADIARLFLITGSILKQYGSIGEFVRSIDNPGERTIEGVMVKFSNRINSQHFEECMPTSGRQNSSYLVPSPENGSACKRLAMYFRWMVRGPDGVDLGLWKFIDPARLVVPVDRHIARMGRLLGLTARKNADWKMTLEISEALRCLDPRDPMRYDFALVRPGILRKCTSSGKKYCPECVLSEVCTEAR